MVQDRVIGERMRRIQAGLRAPEELPGSRGSEISIDDALRHYLVPGCSVAIVDGGRLVAARGYGVLGADVHKSVAANTIFQACSISKPVAAMAALRLVDQGHLALDEDVNGFLTSWRIPANGGWQPRVTLRHLLTHSAGLNYCWFPGYRRGSSMPTTLQTLEGEPPANTPPARVVGLPGALFRYSGTHYAVLQLLIEDVTGEAFPDALRQLVFEPLGMSDSSYDQDFPETRPDGVALGHDAAGVPLTGGWHLQPEYAGAGLWTTPGDLCRLALEIHSIESGVKSAFLGKRIVDAMLEPGVGDRGLGWQIPQAGEGRWFAHGGDNTGYKCYMVADAVSGRGAAVMTNGDAGRLLYPLIFAAIAREFDWPDGVIPAAQPAFRPPERDGDRDAPVSPERLAGEYRLTTGLLLRVVGDGSRLTLQVDGQPALGLDALNPLTYLAENASVALRFVLDAEGNADRLLFHQFGDELAAERIG